MRFFRSTLGFFVFCALALQPTHSAAATQNLQLPIGYTFEIVADSNQTTWTLEKDDEFIQADTGTVFQYRFTQPGTYSLQAKHTDNGANAELQLHITVDANTPPVTASNNGTSALVRTTELLTDGTMKLIQVEANATGIQQLLLDTNLQIDTNGDNDPVNDNILRSTFFSAGKGTLYVWLPQTTPTATMLFGARLQDGSIATQQVPLGNSQSSSTAASAASEGLEHNVMSASIRTEQRTDNSVQFFAVPPNDVLQNESFIPLWKFGDGKQSMLDSPVHTYAETGTYNVTLLLRSLHTGQIVHQATTIVDIQIDTTVPPTDNTHSSQATSSVVTTNTTDETEGKSLLWTIFIALVLLGVSIGIGLIVVLLLSRLRDKDLHEHFAEVEEKHFTDTTDAPAPLSMEMPEDTTVTVMEAEIQEETTPESVATEPAKVPSWLTATTSTPNEIASTVVEKPTRIDSAPVATPTPVENNKPEKTEPVVEPVQQAAAPTEVKPKEIVTPPWLQQTETTQAKPTETEKKPAEQAPKPERVTPPWLQQDTEKIENTAVEAAPPEQKSAPETEKIQQPKTENKPDATPQRVTPPWLESDAKKPASKTPMQQKQETAPVAQATNDTTKEEREKERKRRKRQRYRQNKKAREEAAKETATPEVQAIPTAPQQMDIPPANDNEVQFLISADSVQEENNNDSEKKA